MIDGWQRIVWRCILLFEYRMGEHDMLTKARIAASIAIAATSIAAASAGHAQATAAAATVPAGPAVNEIAPDFTLMGADRYGLLKTPVRLSDYRGRTVVLAFFFQARTKG
jgi:cytochrome oxidase Cu insertion factor (SCO1/SenC/PrrC family)